MCAKSKERMQNDSRTNNTLKKVLFIVIFIYDDEFLLMRVTRATENFFSLLTFLSMQKLHVLTWSSVYTVSLLVFICHMLRTSFNNLVFHYVVTFFIASCTVSKPSSSHSMSSLKSFRMLTNSFMIGIICQGSFIRAKLWWSSV